MLVCLLDINNSVIIEWGRNTINGWQTHITLPVECNIRALVGTTLDDNDANIANCAMTVISTTEIRPLTAVSGQWVNNCGLYWTLIGQQLIIK